MTYEEVLEKIHRFHRFGSKLGIERIKTLLELLGDPQEDMDIIHIAGTNGKGSVSRYLYTVLLENGYATGLYTSPFLERFTERIEFNGEEISKQDLVEASEQVFEKVEEMLSAGLASPTEFELVTAIAFCYFKRIGAEIVILEVGLGGRGDSTNVVKRPLACIITSISYDHMEYLGDTLEKIALEKAGILKEGVPVISNVKDEAADLAIRRKACELHCRYYGYPLAEVSNLRKSIENYTFDVTFCEQTAGDLQDGIPGRLTGWKDIALSMIGMHQIDNGVCALTAIQVLREDCKLQIDDERLFAGMRKAIQPGRMELLWKDPYLILDGAHNEAGAQALRDTIAEHFPHKRILLVLGILEDKKSDRLLEHFCSIAQDYVATEPDHERKLSAEILCGEIQKRGKNCITLSDYRRASSYIKEKKEDYDLIICAGSLYLIGAVRGMLRNV